MARSPHRALAARWLARLHAGVVAEARDLTLFHGVLDAWVRAAGWAR